MRAVPVISSVATVAWLASRTRSEATITRRREARSATTPPISTPATSATTSAANTNPTSEAEPPIPSTANASATETMRSPKTETSWPLKRSRKSRLRNTAKFPDAPFTTPTRPSLRADPMTSALSTVPTPPASRPPSNLGQTRARRTDQQAD